MADLVWAEDGEWEGQKVKAGDPLPPIEHSRRRELYREGKAVRAPDPKKKEEDVSLHDPGKTE